MSEELKPCPFCGAKAQYRSLDFGSVRIACSVCMASTDFYGNNDYPAAAKYWNTRPIEDALRTKLESARATVHNKNVALEAYRAELEAARAELVEQEAEIEKARLDVQAFQVGQETAWKEADQLKAELAASRPTGICETCTAKAQAELSALREATRWIPLKEQLPESGKDVLILTRFAIKIAHWWESKGYWVTDDGRVWGRNYGSHWRTLEIPEVHQ